jgi:hypothetical protein
MQPDRHGYREHDKAHPQSMPGYHAARGYGINSRGGLACMPTKPAAPVTMTFVRRCFAPRYFDGAAGDVRPPAPW